MSAHWIYLFKGVVVACYKVTLYLCVSIVSICVCVSEWLILVVRFRKSECPLWEDCTGTVCDGGVG